MKQMKRSLRRLERDRPAVGVIEVNPGPGYKQRRDVGAKVAQFSRENKGGTLILINYEN